MVKSDDISDLACIHKFHENVGKTKIVGHDFIDLLAVWGFELQLTRREHSNDTFQILHQFIYS